MSRSLVLNCSERQVFERDRSVSAADQSGGSEECAHVLQMRFFPSVTPA